MWILLAKEMYTLITNEFNLGDLIEKCIEEPGNYFCELYRTDGVVQNNLIEQLFANYYRKEKYTYSISSPQEKELNILNDFLKANKSAFIEHIKECHTETCENILEVKACENSTKAPLCIVGILKIIHKILVEYSTRKRANMLAIDNNGEICEKVRKVYENFQNFMIVLEYSLPILSELLGNFNSADFPFSLWKFLFKDFISLMLNPLVPEIIEGASLKLRECRRTTLNHFANSSPSKFSNFRTVCEIKATVEILTHISLNENSVYLLESTTARLR